MADDDEEDCMLASEALAEIGAKVIFSSVIDGVELMDYLAADCDPAGKRVPDLIILDLNMPRKDGRQAILEIKSDPACQHIPIIILTTSEEQRDKTLTINAGAESFITKPATFDGWIDIMKSIAKTWLM